MTEFDVKIERPRRSETPAALPLLRLIGAFVGATMILTYALAFVRFGVFVGPVEYLYPAAFVIAMLLLAPGLLALGAFQAMIGAPVDLDGSTLVFIAGISAPAYGAMVWRALQGRKVQTP